MSSKASNNSYLALVTGGFRTVYIIDMLSKKTLLKITQKLFTMFRNQQNSLIQHCFAVGYSAHHESMAVLEVNGFLLLYNLHEDKVRVYPDLPSATYRQGLHVPRTSLMLLVTVSSLILVDIDKTIPTRSF